MKREAEMMLKIANSTNRELQASVTFPVGLDSWIG